MKPGTFNPDKTRASNQEWQRRSQATAREKATQIVFLPRSGTITRKAGDSGLKRQNLARRSPEQAKRERDIAALTKIMLSRFPWCWHCLELGLTPRPAHCLHHVCGKEHEYLLIVELTMPVNWLCHDYIETHEAEAQERGWKISRHFSYELQIQTLLEKRGQFEWVQEMISGRDPSA